MNAPSRPITLLIAALGGEGGGVLTNWIIAAAAALDFPVQSTSIPGVAQRTGATTYYIEIVPMRRSELGGRRPVFALTPGIGDIDILLASELMEASRALAAGFVTPDRTLVIASTSRFYTIGEKAAGGDGRRDPEHLRHAVGENARQSVLFDMEAAAARSGSMINAVMLGALAGSGALPIPAATFETAIRGGGKAMESNLRGFRAGLEATTSPGQPPAPGGRRRRRPPARSLENLELDIAAVAPSGAREIMIEGVRRLAAYQDLAYARLYVERLAPIREIDARAGLEGRLLGKAARHLAVRMSFEDVIRVAQAKIDPARMRRIAEELRIGADEPFTLVEFLKPGIEEMCQLLPAWLARRVLSVAQRRGWLGRVYWGMEIKSTSISGYLRFWLLARLRRWRPHGFRYQEEQRAIESWLGLIVRAASMSPEFAAEVAECARLVKGYGETHKRGLASYAAIEERIIAPVLAGSIPLAPGVDALISARTAALVDPEGDGLERCLADFERRANFRAAAE